MNITLLDKLLCEDGVVHYDQIVISKDNVVDVSTNFAAPLKIRLNAIQKYYEWFGDDIIEILRRIVGIFNITLNLIVEEYLIAICIETEIPFGLRLETAKDLSLCKLTDECCKPLNVICSRLKNNDIPTPQKVDAIYVLMRNHKFKENAIDYFLYILDDQSIQADYRYKIITSMNYVFQQRKTKETPKEEILTIDKDLIYFEKKLMFHFVNNTENPSTIRILAGQFLLSKYNYENVDQMMLSIAENKLNPYNIRADAPDVILRYGKPNYKDLAKVIIADLGLTSDNNNMTTVYENAQNVHTKEIEQSAIDSLEKLYQKKAEVSQNYDFEEVKNILLLEGFSKNSLNRISLDNALYSKLNISLKNALLLVYSYIQNSSYVNILMERLKEELKESENICSTGILERLVNTLTGFDDELGIRISFEDQISAYLAAKLNEKIMLLNTISCIHSKICDCKSLVCSLKKCGKCVVCKNVKCVHICTSSCNEDFIDKVLYEMTISTKFYRKRSTFLCFFRLYISDIMEKMREEFKNDMNIASFDLFFKKALINYEGEK